MTYDITKLEDRHALKQQPNTSCTSKLLHHALDLIDRLQAHNDHLQVEVASLCDKVDLHSNSEILKAASHRARLSTTGTLEQMHQLIDEDPYVTVECPTCGSKELCIPCEADSKSL